MSTTNRPGPLVRLLRELTPRLLLATSFVAGAADARDLPAGPAGPLALPQVRGTSPCDEGEPCFSQPPGTYGLYSFEDCGGFIVEAAAPFVSSGEPITGLRWSGFYEHNPGELPPPLEYVRIEIRAMDLAGCPQGVGESYVLPLSEINEIRHPEQDGFTPADYCAPLPEWFHPSEPGDYTISIVAGTCGPVNWAWSLTDVPGQEGCTRAPEWGYASWVPSTEVYGGESLVMSYGLFCAEALIDLTKSVPGWWPMFGNTTTYTARIYWRDATSGGCFYPGPSKYITLDLGPISTEKGYSLNKGTRDALDLHMNHASNGGFSPVAITTEECDLLEADHDHWTSVITNDCVTEATVTVVSEDFGSFGYLSASASGCDPVGVGPILPREPGAGPTCAPGPNTVKIPRDDNGNDIEDTWWGDATNGTDPTWDEEERAPTVAKGDGLTRYEEWRGVHVQGSHERLLTLTKELFISRENPAYGAADADVVADIYFVTADEINGRHHDGTPGTVNAAKGPRIINFNRTSHTKVDQHGLWLRVGAGGSDPGEWGLARDAGGGNAGPIGPPHTAGRIEVYSDQITAACAARNGARFRYGRVRRANARFGYDVSARATEFTLDTIGHELAHGMNLRHHGDVRVRVDHACRFGADGWYDVNSSPRTVNRRWTSADAQRNCVMNYPYHEIEQSVALVQDARGEWGSSSAGWAPVQVCAHGYGAGCTVPGNPTCINAIEIDDMD